jgi:hypothetical protein
MSFGLFYFYVLVISSPIAAYAGALAVAFGGGSGPLVVGTFAVFLNAIVWYFVAKFLYSFVEILPGDFASKQLVYLTLFILLIFLAYFFVGYKGLYESDLESRKSTERFSREAKIFEDLIATDDFVAIISFLESDLSEERDVHIGLWILNEKLSPEQIKNWRLAPSLLKSWNPNVILASDRFERNFEFKNKLLCLLKKWIDLGYVNQQDFLESDKVRLQDFLDRYPKMEWSVDWRYIFSDKNHPPPELSK